MPSDAAFFAALFADTRAQEVAAFGWPEPVAQAFLQQQHRVREQAYRAQFPGTAPEVVLIEGAPVGRLWVAKTSTALVLVDVAFRAAWRNRGLGRALLEKLQAEARAAKLPVRLSVAVGNPARRLYARAGFTLLHGDEMYEELEWRPAAAPADATGG